MKKTIKVFLITFTLLSLFGCATTSTKSSADKKEVPKKGADSREIVERQLSKDEEEIYNYIFSVLLQNNSVRNDVSIENREYK